MYGKKDLFVEPHWQSELLPTRVNSHIAVYPFLTATLPPAIFTNTVVFETDPLIIVDPATPYEHERKRFDRLLLHYEKKGRSVGAVVLTHHHTDHIADAKRVGLLRGVPMWAHRLTAERVDFAVSKLLEDNEQLMLSNGAVQLEVLLTPGHAKGHICLFEKATRSLIAGDMVAGNGSILIDPVDGHMGTYLHSLKRLIALDPQCVVAAHGLPMFGGKMPIEETLAHRLGRIEQVYAALAEQGHVMTTETLLQKIYPEISGSMLPFARLSLLSTLIFLVEKGRVGCDDAKQHFWRVA